MASDLDAMVHVSAGTPIPKGCPDYQFGCTCTRCLARAMTLPQRLTEDKGEQEQITTLLAVGFAYTGRDDQEAPCFHREDVGEVVIREGKVTSPAIRGGTSAGGTDLGENHGALSVERPMSAHPLEDDTDG